MTAARIMTDNGVKVVTDAVHALAEMNPLMANDLINFEALMCEKLIKNMDKGTVAKEDIPKMIRLMVMEFGELVEQLLVDADSPNLERELADIANFAFLMYQKVRCNVKSA